MSIGERLKQLVSPLRGTPLSPVKRGMYSYMRDSDGRLSRVHLRVEPDGQGTMLVNASTAARLTRSGVLLVKGLLEGVAEEKLFTAARRAFRGTTKAAVHQDLVRLTSLLDEMTEPTGAYPITSMSQFMPTPRESQLIAPFKADLSFDTVHSMDPILDKLWTIGVPHITLLAPKDVNQDVLVHAIEHAEDLGMITGVRGRGTDLNRGTLLERMGQAGLDHLTVLHAASTAELHDGLCGPGDHANARATIARSGELEICPVVQIPLTVSTCRELEETLSDLEEMQVQHLSVFALATTGDASEAGDTEAIHSQALPGLCQQLEALASETNTSLMWAPPVTADGTQSAAEQICAGPRCTGDVTVRVEPDGSVIPARGPWMAAGNLLHDDWETIWSHSAFRVFRERIAEPRACAMCPGLAICESGCPADPDGWTSDGVTKNA
ncbi:SPASM domain-containing protein [Candidatus Eisenbacteria bacterium]|uniref:SPASM domain-containing protein n=1 Tax=Eiseniibacteriota bacterium TaxID=2212470 RepID=A0ABV6YI54_UNCEI